MDIPPDEMNAEVFQWFQELKREELDTMNKTLDDAYRILRFVLRPKTMERTKLIAQLYETGLKLAQAQFSPEAHRTCPVCHKQTDVKLNGFRDVRKTNRKLVCKCDHRHRPAAPGSHAESGEATTEPGSSDASRSNMLFPLVKLGSVPIRSKKGWVYFRTSTSDEALEWTYHLLIEGLMLLCGGLTQDLAAQMLQVSRYLLEWGLSAISQRLSSQSVVQSARFPPFIPQDPADRPFTVVYLDFAGAALRKGLALIVANVDGNIQYFFAQASNFLTSRAVLFQLQDVLPQDPQTQLVFVTDGEPTFVDAIRELFPHAIHIRQAHRSDIRGLVLVHFPFETTLYSLLCSWDIVLHPETLPLHTDESSTSPSVPSSPGVVKPQTLKMRAYRAQQRVRRSAKQTQSRAQNSPSSQVKSGQRPAYSFPDQIILYEGIKRDFRLPPSFNKTNSKEETDRSEGISSVPRSDPKPTTVSKAKIKLDPTVAPKTPIQAEPTPTPKPEVTTEPEPISDLKSTTNLEATIKTEPTPKPRTEEIAPPPRKKRQVRNSLPVAKRIYQGSLKEGLRLFPALRSILPVLVGVFGGLYITSNNAEWPFRVKAFLQGHYTMKAGTRLLHVLLWSRSFKDPWTLKNQLESLLSFDLFSTHRVKRDPVFQERHEPGRVIRQFILGVLQHDQPPPLILHYLDGQRQVTGRIVQPIRILTHPNGYEYLQAYCHLRQEERHFRLDRIQDILSLGDVQVIETQSDHECVDFPLLR